MVWAMILALISSILCSPIPALAEPLEVVSVDDVEEDLESSDSVSSVSEVAPVSPLTDTGTRASYSVYSSVSNNSYSVLAGSMLWHVPFGDDYVFWRSGQYEYRLAFGDLQLSGGTFTGDNLSFVVFSLDSSYSGTFTVSRSSGSLSLSTGNYLVYSNLGHYPILNDSYVFASLFIFVVSVALVMCLLRSIWSFLLRMGVRVHEGYK